MPNIEDGGFSDMLSKASRIFSSSRIRLRNKMNPHFRRRGVECEAHPNLLRPHEPKVTIVEKFDVPLRHVFRRVPGPEVPQELWAFTFGDVRHPISPENIESTFRQRQRIQYRVKGVL